MRKEFCSTEFEFNLETGESDFLEMEKGNSHNNFKELEPIKPFQNSKLSNLAAILDEKC